MSIKVTVTQYLNVRVGKPSVNAPCYNYLSPGSVIEVNETLVTGDVYDGNNKWYQGLDGSYYWSGGVASNNTPNAINGANAYYNSYKQLTNWNQNLNNIPPEWFKTKGNGVKIAVLDTGIFSGHQDLENAICYNQSFDPNGNSDDIAGHGTAVAGIIGARSNYINGVIGVAPLCQIINIRVLFDPIPNATNIISALDSAVQQGADIINLSFDYKDHNEALTNKIIDIATNKKIAIIAAAGDNNDILTVNPVFFPASIAEVISVGTVSKGFFDANPNYNKSINIVGQLINFSSTSISPNFYAPFAGSSAATAFISGITALFLSFKRNGGTNRFSKAEIIEALTPYSTPIDNINYTDATKFYFNII